jgi:hypothetical protein
MEIMEFLKIQIQRITFWFLALNILIIIVKNVAINSQSHLLFDMTQAAGNTQAYII